MGLWIWNRDKNIATELTQTITGSLYGFVMTWGVSEDGTTITTPNNPTISAGQVTTSEPIFIHGQDDFIVSNTKLINPRIVRAYQESWCSYQNNDVISATGGIFLYDENGNSIATFEGEDTYAITMYGNTYMWIDPTFSDPESLRLATKNNGDAEIMRILRAPPQLGFGYAVGYQGFPDQIVCVWKNAARKINDKYMHGFNYGELANYTQLRDQLSSTYTQWKDARNVNFREGQYGGLAPYILQDLIYPPQIVTLEEYQSITGTTIDNTPEPYPQDLSIYGPGGDTVNPHNPYPSGDSPATVDPLDSGTETDSPNTDGTWELPFDTVSLDHARVDSSQAGVYRLVGLTQSQLQLMADYMFSDTSVGEAWENLMKLIYGNVVDTIIAVQEFPMDVADSVGSDIFCFIGRDITTGAFVGKALTSEYRSLDFGSIEVPRYSGTFYDFEPYTTLTLYIPYIGYIDMKPTEVVGSTLYINGWVHLSTGEVTINVRSSRTGVLGSYSGNIGRSLPISSADCTRLYAAIIETAAGLGGYATFGASVSAMGGIEHADPHNMNVARGQYAQAVRAYGSAKKGVRGLQANMLEKQDAYEQAKEEFSSAKTAERQEVQAAERAEREFNEAGLEAYSNAIDAVTSGFEVVRGTHMTPGAGRTSPQICFLRIEVPHQNVSKNQKLLGYPCNSAEVLNSDKLHGYTELRMIDLQIPGISLTELQELESILKGGFYLP